MPVLYDKSTVLFDGKVPVGDSSLDQILSSNPPSFLVTPNRTDFPIRKGQVLARHPSGNGVILAVADSVAHSAIGIAAEDIAIDHAGIIQIEGTFVLEDWTTIIGQPNLQPMSVYYLSLSAGLITGTSPTAPGQVSQSIGTAVSPVSLSIDLKYPILL